MWLFFQFFSKTNIFSKKRDCEDGYDEEIICSLMEEELISLAPTSTPKRTTTEVRRNHINCSPNTPTSFITNHPISVWLGYWEPTASKKQNQKEQKHNNNRHHHHHDDDDDVINNNNKHAVNNKQHHHDIYYFSKTKRDIQKQHQENQHHGPNANGNSPSFKMTFLP